MADTLYVAKKASWFGHAGKVVAVAASSGAALVTMFTALYSYGVIGQSEAHQSIGNMGAAWVGLRPAADTATAIGDTVHYAATVTDKSGSILVGARPTWTVGDSTIAKVLPDGSVIARGPGRTTVSVVVGKFVAHSRVVVRQRVAAVEINKPAGDTTFIIPEGGRIQARARALDSRGYAIAGLSATWQVDDTTVAVLDTAGVVTARNEGRTVISARIDGVTGRSGISVVTPAAAITLVAGTNQRAVAGMPLPQAIVVRATNRKGAAVAGKIVVFRLSEGQGKVDPASIRTDADGRARAMWTLARYPGRQTLFATVENVDSALAIVAESDPLPQDTRIVPLVGLLSGRAGELLAETVGVQVTDSSGRALPDVPVRWTAVDGGSIEAISARTDSLGLAHATWTLAKKTGTQRVRAQVGGGPGSVSIPPVTMTATALSGAPAGLVVESGDKQRGSAGESLPKAVVIRVVDANGSGVSDAELDLSPSAGFLSDSTVRTDSVGRARIMWTMGRSAGSHTLAVHVEGVKKLLKLSAQVRAAAPANLSFDDVIHHEKGPRSGQRTKRLYALVTDLYGNPVEDAKVSFSTTSGTVSPTRAMSDAKGRAELTWKVGSKPGEQLLVGAVRATDVRGEYKLDIPGPVIPKSVSAPKAASHKSAVAKPVLLKPQTK
jgi:Big-like domain-containing protein